MRALISLFLACVSGFAGTIVSASCIGGITTYTGSAASCGSTSTDGASASAYEGYTTASAWSPGAGGAWASASFTGEYIFTAWGGSGDGFAEPLMSVTASGGVGASASASFGGCDLQGSAAQCPWDSIPFEFGVPQMLTLSLSAGVSVPVVGDVDASAYEGGLTLFDTNGNPLTGGGYTYSVESVPEPGTLPLLTGMACAAIIALKRRVR